MTCIVTTMTFGMALVFIFLNYIFMIKIFPPKRLEDIGVNLKHIPLIYCLVHEVPFFFILVVVKNFRFMLEDRTGFYFYEIVTMILGIGSAFIFGILKWHKYVKQKGLSLNNL